MHLPTQSCEEPIRASLGHVDTAKDKAEPLSQSLKDQGKSRTRLPMNTLTVVVSRNPLKIRASLGHELCGQPYNYVSQSLKDQGKSRTSSSSVLPLPRLGRNPLKIRASLGLWTAWHSHVDSRFHCANIRHKREEKVAGPQLIHIKSLLAF